MWSPFCVHVMSCIMNRCLLHFFSLLMQNDIDKGTNVSFMILIHITIIFKKELMRRIRLGRSNGESEIGRHHYKIRSYTRTWKQSAMLRYGFSLSSCSTNVWRQEFILAKTNHIASVPTKWNENCSDMSVKVFPKDYWRVHLRWGSKPTHFPVKCTYCNWR